MNSKDSKSHYKSLEQLRAELFPNLVAKEHKNTEDKNTQKLGTALADESFDRLLGSIHT